MEKCTYSIKHTTAFMWNKYMNLFCILNKKRDELPWTEVAYNNPSCSFSSNILKCISTQCSFLFLVLFWRWITTARVRIWEPSTRQWGLYEDITLIPRRIHNRVTQSNEHFPSRTHVFNAVDTWDTEHKFLHAVERYDALFPKAFFFFALKHLKDKCINK